MTIKGKKEKKKKKKKKKCEPKCMEVVAPNAANAAQHTHHHFLVFAELFDQRQQICDIPGVHSDVDMRLWMLPVYKWQVSRTSQRKMKANPKY